MGAEGKSNGTTLPRWVIVVVLAVGAAGAADIGSGLWQWVSPSKMHANIASLDDRIDALERRDQRIVERLDDIVANQERLAEILDRHVTLDAHPEAETELQAISKQIGELIAYLRENAG